MTKWHWKSCGFRWKKLQKFLDSYLMFKCSFYYYVPHLSRDARSSRNLEHRQSSITHHQIMDFFNDIWSGGLSGRPKCSAEQINTLSIRKPLYFPDMAPCDFFCVQNYLFPSIDEIRVPGGFQRYIGIRSNTGIKALYLMGRTLREITLKHY